MIVRNRSTAANNGRQYGGVAIASRHKSTNLCQFSLNNPDDYEVLAAHGTVRGIKDKVFCVVAYIPPNYSLLEARGCIEYISEVVQEGKRKYQDCVVVVAGDFNHWPIEEFLEEHPDIKEVIHGATRGTRSIDRSFVNFSRSITEATTLEPLECEAGSVSDHRIAFAEADFISEKPRTITYSYRRFEESAAVGFLDWIKSMDWKELRDKPDTSSKADYLARELDGAMERFFPMKTTTKLESDPPWINDEVRRQVKKRRKIYNREGRSFTWKQMKKRTRALIRRRAKNYMEGQKKVLLGPDAIRNFYKNVRAYKSKEKPPNFEPQSLYPGLPDLQVAENLAQHFNNISEEFDGLDPNYSTGAFSHQLPVLSVNDVATKLRTIKKPKSMVAGDIFPQLVTRAADWLAIPLAMIYNDITRTACWPDRWKTEFVTPIPKTAHPETANDLRNISCTLLISKVYESFVLGWLTSCVKLRRNQFGGVKGASTEHFLIEMWQRVLEGLEDQRAGSLLTSIDYSKAFNRMDFGHCLRTLEKKGAPAELLRIVASFLTSRTMRVKVGSDLSEPRDVKGGVPQGSLLGVFLFNCAIDLFEEESEDVEDYNEGADNTRRPVGEDLSMTRDYLHLPQWQAQLLQVLKYVDDNILNELVNFEDVHTDVHGYRTKRATRTEALFRTIVAWAESVGMKVNSAKTQMMCVSNSRSYIPAVFIEDAQGNQIKTTNKMKILGFNFSSEPHMDAQVESIKKKFRSRTWILRHLGHNGFNQDDLLRVYTSIILPIHDYCSSVYTSSLTAKQEAELERLQALALKSIYGYEYSYRQLLASTGLLSLKERRSNKLDKFAMKARTGKLSHWFPLNQQARFTRGAKKYKETRAKTERLRNSPIFAMRRRLNEIYSTQEA